MSTTDTPKTMKALVATQGLFRASAEVNGFADHARTLERANTELAATNEAYISTIRGLETENARLAAEVARLKEERDSFERMLNAQEANSRQLNRDLQASHTVIAKMREALRRIRNSAGEQVMVCTAEGHSECVHVANMALSLAEDSVRDEIKRLEGENTTLRNAQKCCEDCMTPTYQQLRTERDALLRDKERLDWLASDPYPRTAEMRVRMPTTPYCPGPGDCVRAAIDAASK